MNARMLPFIREHHQDSNYIFWSDLASCHYSKQTVAWMDENVKFVPKDINPPNVPQARPIENVWGCLAQKVYEGGWETKTEQQLIYCTESSIKEFDEHIVESHLEGVKAKVKSTGENGVYFLF